MKVVHCLYTDQKWNCQVKDYQYNIKCSLQSKTRMHCVDIMSVQQSVCDLTSETLSGFL